MAYVHRLVFSAFLVPLAVLPAAEARGDEGEDAPSPSVETAPDNAAAGGDGFRFGSYGRIVAGSDLQGGRAKPVEVASYGPRLIEDPYVEADFSYRVSAADGASFRTVLTLGITEALFHLNGRFDGAVTLRNAFVEAEEFGVTGLSIWAGSRMVRGDDIYLLDFWPLDELNTVGAGAGLTIGSGTRVDVHAGVNQLDNHYQYQEVDVPAPDFGVERLILLDRVRALASVRVEHALPELIGDIGLKFVAYGNFQTLGEGVYENDDQVRVDLPSDRGWTAGGQVGVWGFGRNAFANLFFRASGGLAAYGELAVPRGVDGELAATSARLLRGGISANWESRYFGATVGGYVQRFRDGDGLPIDRDDYTEGVLAVRPMVFVTEHFHQVFEASYQRRVPEGLSARTDT